MLQRLGLARAGGSSTPRAPRAGAAAARCRCAAPPRCAGRGSRPSSSRSRSLASREHRQRLVGVRGDHHLVEALGALPPPPAQRSRRGRRGATDRPHRRAQADALAERRRQRLDVARASRRRPSTSAAGRGSRACRGWRRTPPGSAPGRARICARVGRPHGRDLRDDQPLDERSARSRGARGSRASDSSVRRRRARASSSRAARG